MTYCVAMRLDAGMVFLADSRTNAGVDQINTFRKMTVFEVPGERMLVLLSSGNLAISQAALNILHERLHCAESGCSLHAATSMHEAACMVGAALREVHARDAAALNEFGIEFAANFILGGQIGSEPMRLFMIYAAGNFIEATADTPYFQIGEAKYGKPIIDRVIDSHVSLADAAKCALISMDSTIRSNLSVGLPLDLLVYETGSLQVGKHISIDRDDPYFALLRQSWGARLREAFDAMPAVPFL